MTDRRVWLGLALAGTWPLQAAAQQVPTVRDTISIPATVQLDPPVEPALELSITQPLSFGTVRIPNRVVAGTTCRHTLRPDSRTEVFDSSSNETGSSGGQSRNGCEQISRGQAARIVIACNRDRVVSATLRATTAAIPNLAFSLRAPIIEAAALDDGTFLEGAQASLFRFACQSPAGSPSTETINFGATLTVGQSSTLSTTTTIQVGTLEFEVFYA